MFIGFCIATSRPFLTPNLDKTWSFLMIVHQCWWHFRERGPTFTHLCHIWQKLGPWGESRGQWADKWVQNRMRNEARFRRFFDFFVFFWPSGYEKAPRRDVFTFGSENLEKTDFVNYALCAWNIANSVRIWYFGVWGESCLRDRPDHVHDRLVVPF